MDIYPAITLKIENKKIFVSRYDKDSDVKENPFIEVSNPKYLDGLVIANWSELPDGIYDAPGNLEFELQLEPGCGQCTCDMQGKCNTPKWVAVLSFVMPVSRKHSGRVLNALEHSLKTLTRFSGNTSLTITERQELIEMATYCEVVVKTAKGIEV